MNNKTYDILKAIALFLPLVNTFVAAIIKIWNIPYGVEICGSLTAFNTLFAGIVAVASKNYKKKVKK